MTGSQVKTKYTYILEAPSLRWLDEKFGMTVRDFENVIVESMWSQYPDIINIAPCDDEEFREIAIEDFKANEVTATNATFGVIRYEVPEEMLILSKLKGKKFTIKVEDIRRRMLIKKLEGEIDRLKEGIFTDEDRKHFQD